MLIKFTPEKLDLTTDEEKQKEGHIPLSAQFEGVIEIRAPSYPERLRFPKEIGLDSVMAGKDEDKVKASLNQMEMLAVCSEKVKPFINSVKLKYLEDGTELNSAEDLFDFPYAGALVTGLCTKFILGFLEKKL